FRIAQGHASAHDESGGILWPGYGENIRVLEWMIGRIHGDADARSTLLSYVPTPSGIDLSGLGMSGDAYDELFEIDDDAWALEAEDQLRFLSQLGSRLPDALVREHAALVRRIASTRSGSYASATAGKFSADTPSAPSR